MNERAENRASESATGCLPSPKRQAGVQEVVCSKLGDHPACGLEVDEDGLRGHDPLEGLGVGLLDA